MTTVGRAAIAAACLLAGLTGAADVRAQPSIEAGLRGSYLPLYAGDATVGAVHGLAATVHAGLVLGPEGQVEVEAFYTFSPRDTDPYNRAPRIQLAGGLLHLSRGVDAAVSAVGTVGVGLVDIAPEETGPCNPPLCFDEGGPSYRDAVLPTAIGGLGLDLALQGPVRLRLDARGHLPLGADDNAGDSGKLRLEVGAGLRILLH
jgi:hypothetical protein